MTDSSQIPQFYEILDTLISQVARERGVEPAELKAKIVSTIRAARAADAQQTHVNGEVRVRR
jgi:hypothetical protein